MSDTNNILSKVVKPYEYLLASWIKARDHVLEIIKENPDQELIDNVARLDQKIDILGIRIKYFKDTYYSKNS